MSKLNLISDDLRLILHINIILFFTFDSLQVLRLLHWGVLQKNKIKSVSARDDLTKLNCNIYETDQTCHSKVCPELQPEVRNEIDERFREK